MAIRNIYSAESWTKIYEAFSSINFAAYDYDTIKDSLLQYLKTYHPESFNDFIESSEMIAFLEMFAYIAEQLAYRVDMLSHENFISTAQRKQSVLRLAKLVSYKISRNTPARGLVKITGISTTEQITDSQGNNLSNFSVRWNDTNNSQWKEQFFLIMNRVLTGKFGQPQKSIQVGDVAMQLYTFNNDITSLLNGVHSYIADTGSEQFNMEIVPIDIDENGPYERVPDNNSQLSLVYASDGVGDGSDYTGFLMFTKQGTLSKIEYTFTSPIPNRSIELAQTNINQTDIWINKVNESGTTLERWEEIDVLAEENLVFNTNKNRKKYEVETLENDRVKILFGDGDFSDVPLGTFNIWLRQSANRSIVIQKNKIVDQKLSFSYTSSSGMVETCTLTYSLAAPIQNSSSSETIDHIRQAAPATYYAQNRMVNGQDYNTYMLKDPSILRLKTINRTFAGQPKYIDWNDASGNYENVKLFGDDLKLAYEISVNTINTSITSRSFIDRVLEPLLSTSALYNMMVHTLASDPATYGIISTPRRTFIENNSISMTLRAPEILTQREKTLIQGALDRHWYGEPLSYVNIGGVVYAKIKNPADYPEEDDLVYPDSIPRTYDGVNPIVPGDTGSKLQAISSQDVFGLKFSNFTTPVGNGTISYSLIKNPTVSTATTVGSACEVWTLEIGSDGETVYVTSSLRGSFKTGTVGTQYIATNPSAPINFLITAGSKAFIQGDAFIIDISYLGVNSFVAQQRSFVIDSVSYPSINLSGRWDIINGAAFGTIDPNDYEFDPKNDPASWLIWVKAIKSGMGDVVGFDVHHRVLKLVCQSDTTKFWYNSSQQIVDADTKNRVFDKIKVLRSNLTSRGIPLGKNEEYDVIGPVLDSSGSVDPNKLEIIPVNTFTTYVNDSGVTANMLQFELFAYQSYQYFTKADPTTELSVSYVDYNGANDVVSFSSGVNASFAKGSFVDLTQTYIRKPIQIGAESAGLDFMWQHFSPYGNLIDPSPSNIHDAFVLTRGYYDNMISYLRGLSTTIPVAPTPLELRNSYGYLLKNKMSSDTVVLHSGKIKLLFGQLADSTLRAKFKVVKSQTATLTNERIKNEILSVINEYFSIENWDFSDTFYATELLGLIHQRLATEIASVVLVPLYSINSFGSLFTVESGIDEVLQSCAKIEDIEIVDALTPTVLRQK